MAKTILIAAFEGWNDACQSATNTVRHLLKAYESQELCRIGNEGYYDYQATRPMICTVHGRRRIVWPQTRIYNVNISPELRIIALIAPEPNYRWEEYCEEVLRIAEEQEAQAVITFGSMFDECPHTRPLPLDISNNNCECESGKDYSGPAGIPNILDDMASEKGLRTTSVWVSVPHYCAEKECVQGTLELVRALSTLLNIPLEEGDLPEDAARWRESVDDMVERTEIGDYVADLEHDYDLNAQQKKMSDDETSSCEELMREVEAFLHDGGSRE